MPRIFSALLVLLIATVLSACSGVPLRSIPKLLQLSNQLLEANPAEFTVALQVDARLAPPPDAVPLLLIKVTPKEATAFPAIDKKLPLQVAVANAATLGLEAPALGRRWLVYTMPASTQTELQAIQTTIRKAKEKGDGKGDGKGGGTLAVGIAQDSLTRALTDPVLLNTRWETWLQTKKVDGFFEVWSGTPAQLQAAANKGS